MLFSFLVVFKLDWRKEQMLPMGKHCGLFSVSAPSPQSISVAFLLSSHVLLRPSRPSLVVSQFLNLLQVPLKLFSPRACSLLKETSQERK